MLNRQRGQRTESQPTLPTSLKLRRSKKASVGKAEQRAQKKREIPETLFCARVKKEEFISSLK